MTTRKRKKKLPEGCIRIYLHDECPRLGSGWRIVQVVSSGYRWARLKDVSTKTVARLPASAWLSIERKAVPL